MLFREGDKFTHVWLIVFGEFVQSCRPLKESADSPKTDKEVEISQITQFMALGLEEALLGSETYTSSVKCMTAFGEIQKPELIDLYKNLIKTDKSASSHRMIIPTAVVYKVKKDIFMKLIVHGRSNSVLDLFIADKVKFLDERRRFLSMKEEEVAPPKKDEIAFYVKPSETKTKDLTGMEIRRTLKKAPSQF